MTLPVRFKYDTKDYLWTEYRSLRRKFDAPKNRILAFIELPAGVSEAPLFGWSGWMHSERATMLLGLDEKAESAGVPVKERHGLLYSAWFLLPYVAWENAKAAAHLRAEVRSEVGEHGLTATMLEAWAAGHPPPGRTAKVPRGKSRASEKRKTIGSEAAGEG